MHYAPIAVFACRRPDHLKDLVDSLKQNPESIDSDLKIFIGGPKYEKDWGLVRETINVAKEASGFRSIQVETKFDHTTGSGLIHSGVDQILKTHNSVIVLEDDLMVHEGFLNYMNKALIEFQDNAQVSQISGWNYGTISEGNASATYLFPVPTPWGWATWRRAWNHSSNLYEEFDWLTQKSKRIHDFNFKENYDCLGMIEAVIKEGYDAWDAVWYLRLFRHGKLILHPNNSLVVNRGFDGSGLNFKHTFSWDDSSFGKTQKYFTFPSEVIVSPEFKKYLKYLRKWIKASEGRNGAFLFSHKVIRKVRQHIRYYRKGFYFGN